VTTSLTGEVVDQMREIVSRYPRKRSAIMPLLHLVQAEQGYVTPGGIELISDLLDITEAEVSAVATFYTMYVRKPGGIHHVGVCTNTLCAVLGGDAIWDALTEYTGVGHHETTDDGSVTLERIECQAACTHAPVMTANWEFMDNMTVESAKDLVDDLRAGRDVRSTRGPGVGTWAATERALVLDDDLSDADVIDDLVLAGLRRARELGQTTPLTAPAPAAEKQEA
jgi:NADH-quinone oxidoreductase subunit E